MSTDKSLQELIEGVMVDKDVCFKMAQTLLEGLLINTFNCFRQDAAGTFVADQAGIMPASAAMAGLETELVTNCQFVDPLTLMFDNDEPAFTLKHERVPCFLECKHDELRATRIYVNIETRHFIGINVTYEEGGSPYMPAEASSVRVMPVVELNNRAGFASFWNLTQFDTEHLDTLREMIVYVH